ncbi:MAG: Ppx/GppA family phosphatase [Deltaproteobacteria bacterium]|nr:Ppx/GppA family phosphatase [Deltaproteobacteria bacterium]
MTNLASIDIGSHTARLLVSRQTGNSGLFRPLVRKRAYIRLAEGLDDQGRAAIRPDSIDRTLSALEDFATIAREFSVDTILAVSTGVVRKAANRDDFLNLIYNHTGIKVKLISGEEEARLTGKGVLHSLDIHGTPFMIFDLGGGSTEFVFGDGKDKRVKSIFLGAMTLTQKYLTSDPPEERSIEALEKHVGKLLQQAFPPHAYSGNDHLLVGSGGTVTTLAAMIHSVETKEISPDRMNGLILKREWLEDIVQQIKTMTITERLKLTSLDEGRADVILAGSIVVIRILHFFKSVKMVVSLSDILEGILIEHLDNCMV